MEYRKNKPGRVIQCVSQAEIVVLGGFAYMLTDGRTDGWTYGRTDPHVEMRERIYKEKEKMRERK